MKYAALVWSSLKRKKLRTTLTFLSIAVAFILFGLLGAIKLALSQGVEIADADRLIVRHKVSIIQMLPYSYGARISQTPGVELATPFVWFGGTYKDNEKSFFAQMPTEPDSFLDMYPEFVLSDDEVKAWKATRTGAIAGSKIAERFGWEVGDKIQLLATIWPRAGGERVWEFDLVGIYEPGKRGADATQFFFRYDYFDEARARGQGTVGWYAVRVANSEDAPQIAKAIDATFANSPYETKAETEGAFVAAFAKQMGNITTIIVGIVSAVFFTILLVAGNTMAQSVRERIVELAVMKAVGFTDRLVTVLVMVESLLLALSAAAVGLGLAALAINIGGFAGSLFPTFYVPDSTFLWGACFGLLLGIVAGAVPARQAMKLNVATALRR